MGDGAVTEPPPLAQGLRCACGIAGEVDARVHLAAGEPGQVHKGKLDAFFQRVGQLPRLLDVTDCLVPLVGPGCPEAAEVGHRAVKLRARQAR